MSTTEYILLLAGGATGTEVVRWLLNFRRDRRQDERQGEQVEFQHFTDLNKQATELRDEMRRNNTELRTELNQLRGEVESWRRSYFDLFHTAREIQQSSGGRDKLMFTGDGPAPTSTGQQEPLPTLALFALQPPAGTAKFLDSDAFFQRFLHKTVVFRSPMRCKPRTT